MEGVRPLGLPDTRSALDGEQAFCYDRGLMIETEERTPYTLIRDMPETERPRERLRDYGPQSLSAAELLAILLRVGSARESALAQAQRLLTRFDGLAGIWRASIPELCHEHGLGEAKAAQLKAALELGLRVASATPEAKPLLRTPEDIADLMLAEMSLLDHEEVRVVLLDSRNRLISTSTAYMGSVHTAQVRIGELLSEALRAKAPSLVLVHNHPSGDPTPSSADGMMTRQLYDACRLMDIALEDHMVIGGGAYVSMRAIGLGFPHEQRSAGR
jgi:DNA repair protein RadC